MGKYTEYSKLINNETPKRDLSFCKILFYTFIIVMMILICVLLSLSLLLPTRTELEMKAKVKGTPMRLIHLAQVDPLVKTKFSHLTQEEFEAMSGLLETKCQPYPSNDDPPRPHGKPGDAVDWRNMGVVGGVVDQRECDACWQISIIGVMESMVGIKQISKNTFHGTTPLSIQELIDCSYKKPGCSKGDPRSALEIMLKENTSIVTDQEYPLTLKLQSCKFSDHHFPKGVQIERFKVFCKQQGQVTSELIKYWLWSHGPVVATVNSGPWIGYSGGIIIGGCSGEHSNHVVQIVGYDYQINDGHITHYYIIKNSWGVDFGDNGYVYIEMGKNICGIEEYISLLDVRF